MEEKRGRGRPKKEGGPKRAVSIKLEAGFHEELQAAAAATGTSVNAILEEGAAALLKKLEKKHNGGRPFLDR